MIGFMFFDHALKVSSSFYWSQLIFLFKNVFNDLGVGVWVTERKAHTVIIVLKFNIKNKTVVVENFSFPYGALGTQGCHLLIWAHPLLRHCCLLSKLFFSFLILVRISTGSQHIFFSALHPWLNKLELIRADTMPFRTTKFWLENYSLSQFRFTSAWCPRNARLCEVLDVKLVLPAFPRVSYSEVKPLLMPLCVRIYLHVHVVFFRCNPVCLKQVSRFNNAIKK